MMYGILAIDAGLRIRGNLDLPKVEGRLAVAENTDFTFVLPQSSPALQGKRRHCGIRRSGSGSTE